MLLTMRSLKLWHLISAISMHCTQPVLKSSQLVTEPSAGLEQEETEHDVDLIHECVVKMAKEISDFMDITPDKQRMDSLMVAANIRNLSLLELFYTCVDDTSEYQLLIRLLKERTIIDDGGSRRLRQKRGS